MYEKYGKDQFDEDDYILAALSLYEDMFLVYFVLLSY